MSKQEDQLVYRVAIVRQDLPDPLYVQDTVDIKAARKAYQEMVAEWKNSVEGKRPFQLEESMRSFSPSLVLEIKVEQMTMADFDRMSSPFEREMRDKGTSAFMQGNFRRG